MGISCQQRVEALSEGIGAVFHYLVSQPREPETGRWDKSDTAAAGPYQAM